jgi:hypothetical protein
MKKVSLFFAVLILSYIGLSLYISSHTKEYLNEMISSYNKSLEGDVLIKLKDYQGQKAVFELQDIESNKSIQIDAKIEKGPIFDKDALVGLIRVTFNQNIRTLLNDDGINPDFSYHYDGLLSFMHIIYEHGNFSNLKYKSDNIFIGIAPLKIYSIYIPETLRGNTEFYTNKVVLNDIKEKKKVEIKEPHISIKNDKLEDDEPPYGNYHIVSDDISFYENDKDFLHIASSFSIDIKKSGTNFVDIAMRLDSNKKDSHSSDALMDIVNAFGLKVEFKSLGLDGIRKFYEIDRMSQKLNRDLATALEKKDDVAMQKALVKLDALQNSWADVFNTLLIKNKTKVRVHNEIESNKKSKIDLELTFVGDKLDSQGMGALIALGANSDKLLEGNINLTLDKNILEKVFPEIDLVLGAMASKGLATLKDGIYHLEAQLKDGKIIINGVKYSPKELAILIFI